MLASARLAGQNSVACLARVVYLVRSEALDGGVEAKIVGGSAQDGLGIGGPAD